MCLCYDVVCCVVEVLGSLTGGIGKVLVSFFSFGLKLNSCVVFLCCR